MDKVDYLKLQGLPIQTTHLEMVEQIDKGNKINQRLKELISSGAGQIMKWHVGMRFIGFGKDTKRRCTCQGNPTITQMHVLSSD